MSKDLKRAAWQVNDWCFVTGCGRTKTYQLMNEGKIQSIKLDKRRLITTDPNQFIADIVTAQQAA